MNVYENQALEKYLLHHVKENEVILYLWQNDHTIVIGKNQDAFDECDVRKLEEEGGHLARRITGGGAVYHDKGNLNFTFLCPRDLFDISKQDEIILKGLNQLGIHAVKNGRNDLEIDGRKFSGHAYYKGKESCMHHGTLMLEVNEEHLSSYLHVSLPKLHSKNVASVKSRIINLKSIVPDLKIEDVKRALVKSAEEVYGDKASLYTIENQEEVKELRHFFEEDKWRYGENISYKYNKERRFSWGTLKVSYDLCEGRINHLAIYTDAMDPDVFDHCEELLKSKRIDELCVEAKGQEMADLLCLLREKENEV